MLRNQLACLLDTAWFILAVFKSLSLWAFGKFDYCVSMWNFLMLLGLKFPKLPEIFSTISENNWSWYSPSYSHSIGYFAWLIFSFSAIIFSVSSSFFDSWSFGGKFFWVLVFFLSVVCLYKSYHFLTFYFSWFPLLLDSLFSFYLWGYALILFKTFL